MSKVELELDEDAVHVQLAEQSAGDNRLVTIATDGELISIPRHQISPVILAALRFQQLC